MPITSLKATESREATWAIITDPNSTQFESYDRSELQVRKAHPCTLCTGSSTAGSVGYLGSLEEMKDPVWNIFRIFVFIASSANFQRDWPGVCL